MTANGPPATATDQPTGVRYRVLFLVCVLAMITYMDRAMYGSAKDDLMASVGRPVSDFFYILTAFQLAYAVFEIPTGWLGDRYGPRSTLLRIVLWWSIFIALTGCSGLLVAPDVMIPAGRDGEGRELVIPVAFVILVGMQFLFGIGEAGA